MVDFIYLPFVFLFGFGLGQHFAFNAADKIIDDSIARCDK